jgi:hypothetical protein
MASDDKSWSEMDPKRRVLLADLIARHLWQQGSETGYQDLEPKARKSKWENDRDKFLPVARKLAQKLARAGFLQ